MVNLLVGRQMEQMQELFFYRTGQFSITNVCGLIKIKDVVNLNHKFLFYWLSIEAKKYVHSGMGNPKLMSHQIEKIKIALP